MENEQTDQMKAAPAMEYRKSVSEKDTLKLIDSVQALLQFKQWIAASLLEENNSVLLGVIMGQLFNEIDHFETDFKNLMKKA